MLIISVAAYFGIFSSLWQSDATKLSFLIIILWAIGTVMTGIWHTYTDLNAIQQKAKVGWYIAETCLAIGMIGTVAGFLIMLGSAFGNIDVSDTSSLQHALADMATGMSTALYTTLSGLVASLFLKSQLVNLEHMADELR
jgi:hypothetical protein